MNHCAPLSIKSYYGVLYANNSFHLHSNICLLFFSQHSHNTQIMELIDLTVSNRPTEICGDDALAFGGAAINRSLYLDNIWRLKQNDPNFCLLDIRGTSLINQVCERIGVYMCSSTHIKTIQLQSCALTETKMEHLFGSIAQQNETNAHVLSNDILGKYGITEVTLTSGIIESLTSFPNLLKLDVSCNQIRANGLDVLVKSLSGSPIIDLNLAYCGIEDISPLKGTRKCMRLKKLNINNNLIRTEDAHETLSILLDQGHPKLYVIDLECCGIRDDIIELVSPSLSQNKSLELLHLHNYGLGSNLREANVIGSRGAMALINVVHNSSSFKETLASNHTIRKITIEGPYAAQVSDACMINLLGQRSLLARARQKYLSHLSSNTNHDMSPLMEMNIKLIPHLLAKIKGARLDWRGHRTSTLNLTAMYNIWTCKMFIDRIETASQLNNLQARNERLTAKVVELESSEANEMKRNEQLVEENARLVAENERLLEQIANLTIAPKNAMPRPKHKKIETIVAGSIAERVKTRTNTRKRGRR